MAISDELQNYADGLGDAYDAALTMGAVMPAQKNMNNLDTTILTIPQPTVNDGTLSITQNGVSVGTFTANQASNTTVALTDTTYSDFGGATSSTTGSAGLVPAPSAGDEDKYLKGDGTWATVQSGGSSVANFYWDSTNTTMKNSGWQSVDAAELFTALGFSGGSDGKEVQITEGDSTGIVTSYWLDPNSQMWIEGKFVVEFKDPSTGAINVVEYVYDSAGSGGAAAVWSRNSVEVQQKLTAGTNITIAGNTISATDTTYSDFTGATSSTAGSNGLVPAPSAGDDGKVLHGDGTWKDTTAKLVEMSYGESNAWAKFIAAYNAGSIVYCRASSNADPGSGSQTRKAFMAYVNNATSPTSVEFQYVRSVSSKTDSQQCDQVFVYTLTNSNGGTWSVASRNMGPKVNVSGPITKTFTTGASPTVTIGANAMTGATSSAAGAAGIVPAPAAGDDTKVLSGAGTWVAQPTVNDATLTIQQNGTTVDTFTANSSTSKTVNIVTSDDTYSTTEIDTGKKWIDNKTIYRKVYTGTWSASGAQSITVETDASVANIIATGGWFDDGYAKIPFGQAHWTNAKSGTVATNGASYALITGSGLNIRLLSVDTVSNKPYEIWVEYTK